MTQANIGNTYTSLDGLIDALVPILQMGKEMGATECYQRTLEAKQLISEYVDRVIVGKA